MQSKPEIPLPRPDEVQPQPANTPRRLDSDGLLGTSGELEILHQGELYRLRRTRQGKLILTK